MFCVSRQAFKAVDDQFAQGTHIFIFCGKNADARSFSEEGFFSGSGPGRGIVGFFSADFGFQRVANNKGFLDEFHKAVFVEVSVGDGREKGFHDEASGFFIYGLGFFAPD